jgi:hypothetical protein
MSDGQIELLSAVAQVVSAFESLGIDYLVGVSVASSVFGEPRQTIDADIVACLLSRHAQSLLDSLGLAFCLDLHAIVATIKNQSSFNVINLTTMSKVDIFVSWRTPFGQSQLQRRQKSRSGTLERTNSSLPHPRIRCWRSLRSLKRAGASRIGSGEISWPYSKCREAGWIGIT